MFVTVRRLVKTADMLPLFYCGSIHDVEAKYYADGEDAFDMRKNLSPKQPTKRAPDIATKKQPAMVSARFAS